MLVPHYAMSGGTLIALAADEIVMDSARRAGPGRPAAGRHAGRVDPAGGGGQGRRADRRPVPGAGGRGREGAAAGARPSSPTCWTIGCRRRRPAGWPTCWPAATSPTTSRSRCSRARELGLAGRHDLPAAVYELMALFPQPSRGRPSVTYLPLPVPLPGGGRRRRRHVAVVTASRLVADRGPLHPAQVLAVQLQRRPARRRSTSQPADIVQVGDPGVAAAWRGGARPGRTPAAARGRGAAARRPRPASSAVRTRHGGGPHRP